MLLYKLITLRVNNIINIILDNIYDYFILKITAVTCEISQSGDTFLQRYLRSVFCSLRAFYV